MDNVEMFVLKMYFMKVPSNKGIDDVIQELIKDEVYPKDIIPYPLYGGIKPSYLAAMMSDCYKQLNTFIRKGLTC